MHSFATPGGACWHAELLKKTVTVFIDFEDRMMLKWNAIPLNEAHVLSQGQCVMLRFPFIQNSHTTSGSAHELAGEEELNSADKSVVVMMIIALVEQHGPEVEVLRDSSGAGLIHNLAIANTPESIELVMSLLHIHPPLLRGVHDRGWGSFEGQFEGESTLHILAINEKKD